MEQSSKKYTQEQKPNQFHFYNQNMGFVNRIVERSQVARLLPSIGIGMKIVVVPVCYPGYVGIVSY